MECTGTHSHQDNGEWEHFLLSSGDEAISIMSFAEQRAMKGDTREVCSHRNEARHCSGGHSAFPQVLRGNEERHYKELHEATDYMEMQRSGLLATVERKNRLMKGASEKISEQNLQGDAHGC